MKSKICWLIISLLVALLILSCKENEPQGDEFSWTQAGDRLALVSLESRELLTATAAQDSLVNFFVIDKLVEQKERFHAPTWSDRSDFLLYSKSTPKDFRIFLYKIAESKRQQLAQVTFRQENDRNRLIAPFWAPGSNQVIWVDWIGEQKTLYAQGPEAGPPRVLYRGVCDHLLPQPVPGQDVIAFSLQIGGQSARNGLWVVPLTGGQSQQIYPYDRLVNYRWAPDGRKIALVCQAGKEKAYSDYELAIIDADGANRKSLARFDQEITALDWSPDGLAIAAFEASDSVKNVWVVDIQSGESVRLTFDNAEHFFGWGGPETLYYAVKPMGQPPVLEKEETDLRETIDILLGKNFENQLVMLQKFKPRFLDQNVNAFRLHPSQLAWAAYKTAQTVFLRDPVYYPVVRFSDNKSQIIARDKTTDIVAADQMYRIGSYNTALDFLTRSFDPDVTSSSSLAQFKADSILATNPEVTQVQNLQNRVDLWRVIATLRKLGKIRQADWLCTQHIRLFDYCRRKSDKPAEATDGFLWDLLNVNSRYGQFTQGIRDLDQILQYDPADSLFAYAIYTHQAYLALLGRLPDTACLKLKAAIALMPIAEQAQNDLKDALSFLQQLHPQKKSESMAELYDAYLNRVPADPKVYAQVGELYQKLQRSEKAFAAYQKAVVLNGGQNEIWDKIFALARAD